MQFRAKVQSIAKIVFEAEVEVEAPDKAAAKAKIKEMYDKDELNFNNGKTDFDSARISDITFIKS